jgi:transcriptional accessory protein Tex/SPT6
MDYNQLETLIKKYWDCETSLEEEERLREWFRTHEVPERFKETAKLFSYFDEQKQKAPGERFDKQITAKLNASPTKGKVVGLWQMGLRIAAGIAVVVAAIFFVRQELIDKHEIAEINDPQQALEETKKALMMISKGFITAEENAKKINVLNEAEDKVKEKKSL